MSNNRQLVSDIRELDRGITDCEQFLAKVLNRKIESSRQAPANKKKNVPAKSTSRPQSRGGGSQTLHRAPSVGASSTRDTTKSANLPRKSVAVVHSHPRKVSADRLPKPKSSDGHRMRSNSASRLATQCCTCEPPLEAFSKLPIHVHVPRVTHPATKVSEVQAPVKSESLPHPHRSRSPGSKNKNLSWGQILRENQQTCKVDKGQWDISGARHTNLSHPSFNTKIPHECEPIKECSSSECTATASCNHFFKVTVPKHPHEESFSSEGTSGFSSNNELPSHLTNKSVQCGIPNLSQRPKSSDHYQHRPSSSDHCQPRRVSSSSSGASSQKPEEKDKVIGVLGSDVFSIFNPVRTLNFLIKELQGLLQKHPKEDESICRIIADMEKVLHRLPEGEDRAESTSGYTTRSKPHDSHSVTSASTRSCDTTEKVMEDDGQKAAIVRALQTVPALARRIDERAESMRKKIVDTRTQITVPAFAPAPQEALTTGVENILRLQRHVENSGHQLEIMCQAMEQACDIMRSERDALQGKVDERDRKLRVAKSQEQDFVTTVTSLRTNLESATRRVTQLSVENKVLKEQVKEIPNLKYIEEKYKQVSKENEKLKEENKNLDDKVAKYNQEIQKLKESSQNQVGVAEATKRLTQRLQETMKERDEAQHDAQMLRIEREKLLVLQHNKDEELSHFVQDIINIKMLVTSQLNALKTNVPKMSPPESLSDVLNSSSESDEFTSASQCQPVCSSPTSTASGVAPVEDVWQDVSTIVPEQTRSSPEILFKATPKKGEETESPPDFKSICRDAWHSIPPTNQGVVPDPENSPPQTRTAVPDQSPPTDNKELGTVQTQWTGAAAVTQELHENVQELFKLINNKSAALGSTDAPSSARTVATVSSSLPSSRLSSMPGRTVRLTNRNFQFEVPRLPDPPKFLETPEFSDFSSYHGSLADTSSVESIDAVLQELQKGDQKQKKK